MGERESSLDEHAVVGNLEELLSVDFEDGWRNEEIKGKLPPVLSSFDLLNSPRPIWNLLRAKM